MTASDIPTVAEARAGVAGVMARDFGHEIIVKNNGGTVGVGNNPGRGGGGAFMVEFNIARIDDAAFFGVAFDVGAEARGAEGRPRARGADWERERDRVQGGAGAKGFEDLLRGGFSVGHHGAERSGVCSVNIPRVTIAVDKGGCRTGKKRDRGLGAYGNSTIDVLGPSKIRHSVSLPGVLSKTLMVGPPYRWVTSTRYPTGVRS